MHSTCPHAAFNSHPAPASPGSDVAGDLTPRPAPDPDRLTAFIESTEFPCVGAKSALNKGRLAVETFGSLDDLDQAPAVCSRLEAFSKEHPDPGAVPVSLVALFAGATQSEAGFERSLWRFLQAMHDHDHVEFDWNTGVGADPAREDFSFSVAGRAYFVVGMHPHASRLARRSPHPCLVFNFHDQFEHLKQSGKYQSMQRAIRARDLALQGSINPVLARFGEASEARQYAGRAVDADWRCPFQARESRHA